MHELGVLVQVVKEVEKVAAENNLKRVDGVVLNIGELTGMMPYFFEEYYEMVTDDSEVLKGSKLIIETTPGLVRCEDCGEEYNLVEAEGKCPHCGSQNKELLTGTEFLIQEIIVAEDYSATA